MNPRILVILPRIPYPARDGAEVVMSELLRGFREIGQEVDVFALNPSRQHKDALALAPWCRVCETFDIDTSIRKGELVRQLLVPKRVSVGRHNIQLSYWLSRFVSQQVMDALARFVQANGPYHIIHCETLFTTAYGLHVRELSPESTILYRSHNVEWRIQDRLSKEGGAGPVSRIVRRRLAYQTRAYESYIARCVQSVACISQPDEMWYRQTQTSASISTVLPGIAIPAAPSVEPQSPVLGFLGSLDWEPNRSAIQWFVTRVFPLIRTRVPKAEFHVAGRGSAEYFHGRALPNGVTCLGEVSSVNTFYNMATVVVAPLFSGSGVRVKLLEAFAHSKAVVTTSQGAEGIEWRAAEVCAVSDSEVDFANQCVRLLANEAERHAVGSAARNLVTQLYSTQASASKMLELYTATSERF